MRSCIRKKLTRRNAIQCRPRTRVNCTNLEFRKRWLLSKMISSPLQSQFPCVILCVLCDLYRPTLVVFLYTFTVSSFCILYEVELLFVWFKLEKACTALTRAPRPTLAMFFVPRDLDLWPFDPIQIEFPGLMVDHNYVKFGDPSSISV